MNIPQKHANRQEEITDLFLQVMNKHLDDLVAGRSEKLISLKEIASEMCLHPVHVTNVVKLHTGHHPCHFYELRILEEAKKLLANSALTITEIAYRLTYDKSNFTKFFKHYQGVTPSEYRRSLSV
jgi:AraC-like DNA-binding protein